MQAQNINVSHNAFTAQQLIEDVLIDSDCIQNIVVTNVIGGNFAEDTKSYGYFNANGSDFPFESGIVLSTGKLSNVPGPNTYLSDDDAPGWVGDTDLETVLNEQNTVNATLIEFDFTSVASEISFRYIFASEEYQENNSDTCRYSDLFGFLIRPADSDEYTNIALVPNTNTPVKVTTVRPEIPGACPAENEFYFGSWNGPNAPINFNGQTKVLTATANIVPNQTYHVKLVIADEKNYRYDSAVFLEAASFRLATNLGADRLISNRSAICEGETLTLNAGQPNTTGFKWFKDELEIPGETASTYLVNEPGIYSVEVTLNNTCASFGSIVVEYSENPSGVDSILVECDQDQDGITYYNLFDAKPALTNNDSDLLISNFYNSEADAILEENAIQNPNFFLNTTASQIVYARIENQNRCFTTAELGLEISTNNIQSPILTACDENTGDGFADFNLDAIANAIENQIPADAVISYYATEEDAFNATQQLPTNFRNTIAYSQTIYIKVSSNNQCFAIGSAQLKVNATPILEDDETVFYCESNFPETLRLFGGVQNDLPNNYYYEWLFNGQTTEVNTTFNDINEIGVYTVIVTSPNGCSTSRQIHVNSSENATIENIQVTSNGFYSTVQIFASGFGTYEYALDNSSGNYQESTIFQNVTPGFHTLYVRDLNACEILSQEFAVLGFPKYFSPNGDGIRDHWQVYGANSMFNFGTDIKIFNRHGKLLAIMNETNIGWDGTYNSKNLPADDYWYVVTLKDGTIFRGHFSLLR